MQGFPRSDIDIPAVRAQRSHLAGKLNFFDRPNPNSTPNFE